MQLQILLGIFLLADAELDGGGAPSSLDSVAYTAGYAAGYAAGLRARCNEDAHPLLRGGKADTATNDHTRNPVKASIDRPRLAPDFLPSATTPSVLGYVHTHNTEGRNARSCHVYRRVIAPHAATLSPCATISNKLALC